MCFDVFLMYFDVFWCVLMCFDVFWCVLTCFDVFWCVLMHFDVFWCVWCVLMCFDVFWWLCLMCFDVFWCVLMCFGVFWCVLMCFDVFWCVLMCFDVFWCVLCVFNVFLMCFWCVFVVFFCLSLIFLSLWFIKDVYWDFIGQYGFTSDWISANVSTKGNRRMLQLILDGIKSQPCHPTFIDARDAILEATTLRYPTDYCLVWRAFAKRGLGYRVDTRGQRDSHRLPPQCQRKCLIVRCF